MESIVTCKGVSKTFGQGEIQVRALADIDLEIYSGGFTSLVGPSGSGKTTLLNLIGGLDTPTSGEITVVGNRLEKMNTSELAEMRLAHLGFIFQAYNLIPVLSAIENVEFVMQLRGISASERRALAKEVLADVGLEGLEKRRPAELSGGQQQRVAVARAIVGDPKLVLADEPTANLDSKTAENLLDIMKEMNEKRGVTFVFSTHDELVMQYAERVVKLKDGRIVNDEKKRANA